jgi:hypothetical protein
MDTLSPVSRRSVSSSEAIPHVPVSTEPLHLVRGSWSLRSAYESAQNRWIPTPHIQDGQPDNTSLHPFRHPHSRLRQPSFDNLPSTTTHSAISQPGQRLRHQSSRCSCGRWDQPSSCQSLTTPTPNPHLDHITITTPHHHSPPSRQEHQAPPNSSWAVGNSLLRARRPP